MKGIMQIFGANKRESIRERNARLASELRLSNAQKWLTMPDATLKVLSDGALCEVAQIHAEHDHYAERVRNVSPVRLVIVPLVEAIGNGMAEEHPDHRRRGIRLHAPDEHTPPATERPRVCEEEAAEWTRLNEGDRWE